MSVEHSDTASDPSPLSLAWGLLPFAAVGIGLWGLNQALLSVAIYHAGILFCWVRRRVPVRCLFWGVEPVPAALLSVACLTVWPLVYFLWPLMKQPEADLGAIFLEWGLVGPAAGIFALYSVTLHPALEEGFWRGMMPDRVLTDLLFAGFHLLVLVQWIQWPWLPICFVSLAAASWIWRWLSRTRGGLAIPFITHSMADLGLIFAAWNLLE